ncbi:MAG: chemotaxis protein CheB [Promethearchaeota archaeon]
MVNVFPINVLIADDSAFIRKIISNILSNNQSIEVVALAKNGIEAVQMVKKHNPDVLLLDLLMPKMNGLDALKLIMKDTPTSTIILSAVSPQNLDSSIQALLLGAFDYIIKPGGLGAKDLPNFKKDLITKVLLASQSQFKNILQKSLIFSKKVSLRQEIVNDIFHFGKYLENVKPIKENHEEIKPEKKKLENIINIISENDEIKQTTHITEEFIEKIPENSKDERVILKSKENKELALDEIDVHEKTSVQKQKIKKIRIKSIRKEAYKKNVKSKKNLFKENKKELIKPLIREEKYKILSKLNKTTRQKTDHAPVLTPIKNVRLKSNIIVMGASVGGPKTLKTILKKLPENLSCPVLIVQHLNAYFIETFVKALDNACKIKIKIAENGEYLQPGIVYISPGEMHVEISVKNNTPCIKTYVGTPINYFMPSIDILFFSAARVYKNRTLGILLSGMGEDGVNGFEAIKNFGGHTIAESEETSVLYGMPKIAAERGMADYILPNHEIQNYIKNFATNLKL